MPFLRRTKAKLPVRLDARIQVSVDADCGIITEPAAELGGSLVPSQSYGFFLFEHAGDNHLPGLFKDCVDKPRALVHSLAHEAISDSGMNYCQEKLQGQYGEKQRAIP